MSSKKVLITGVYGLIGGAIYRHLSQFPDRYELYGLARRRQPSRRADPDQALEIPDEKFVLSDLSDLESLVAAFSDIDVVVHMAAEPSERAGWESIHRSNIIGAYHVFEACRQAGVKRLIAASSLQVVLGYQREEPYASIARGTYTGKEPRPMVTVTMPPRPQNLYAASKVWSETLARVYADRYPLSCLCLRIGWVLREDRPPNPGAASIWCSQRDIARLTQCCIDAPESLRFGIYVGLSESETRWIDLASTQEEVGYVPQDRAEERLGETPKN